MQRRLLCESSASCTFTRVHAFCVHQVSIKSCKPPVIPEGTAGQRLTVRAAVRWSSEKVHGELDPSGWLFSQRRLGVFVLLNQALHFPSKDVSSPFRFCNRNYRYFRKRAVNRGRFYFSLVKSLSVTSGWLDSPSLNVYIRKME